jgi:aldehyde dehydrogenase (NAD+)
MYRTNQFYIDGQWVDPIGSGKFDLINPATEAISGTLAMGDDRDVDRAVNAAREAFVSYSQWTVGQRIELLERVLFIYKRRYEEFAQAMTLEMGTPIKFSRDAQAARGIAHIVEIIRVLREFEFDHRQGTTMIRREPIGVCGLITPWNWPINQIVVKIAPALAAGCTIVLKPSEYSALSALLFAEVLDEAGVPPGVFNLVNGEGRTVGSAISAHPLIDMVSFTGSTQAGIQVAKTAADTVKRVAQELGGKSANILLEDADFEAAVRKGVAACFTNSGQSCSIPTRMIVPRSKMPLVGEIARQVAQEYRTGDPLEAVTHLGPLVNEAQFHRVQRLIQTGINEGAELICGGMERPEGLDKGYFVKPTVFANVSPDMTIAQEEIFGPVLSVIPYDTEEHAISIANGTPYGLAAYVQSASLERARAVAGRLRAGGVHLNYPAADLGAPFGGYKQSGNGREWGVHGLMEYLETKSIVGYFSS